MNDRRLVPRPISPAASGALRGANPGPRFLSLLVSVGILAQAACAAPSDEPAATGGDGVGSVVVTQWNDSTELFLEYPHVVAGTPTGNWAIHLTELDVYAPVVEGVLTVRFLSDGAETQTFRIPGPDRDGIFLLDPVVETPGTYRVELELEGTQVSSVHVLDPVRVYPSLAEAPAPAAEEEGGGIAFLKEQQWPIDFGITQAVAGGVTATTELPGEVVARDGGLVDVTAPMASVARAEDNLDLPSVGQAVASGEVLAVLSPVAGSGGYADLVGRVERLEREVARAERLFEAGAIPERRLIEGRHDLEVARAELEAAGGAIETTGEGSSRYRLSVRSPIRGIVAERAFVPGGRIDPGTRLFRIVDPSTVWLRVQVPAGVASRVRDEPLPTFSVEGGTEVHQATGVVSIGSVLNARTRSLPAVFSFANPDAVLKVGQTARVHVAVGDETDGVVVPASAVLQEDGVPVVYVEVGGETFERHVVEIAATDGRRTALSAGIEPGAWVVSTGAYQVRLASLSGESFGAGHSH